ncbi:hypothetical protein F5144DRAFT_482178 [Chaetomium tenue]|uniref:Uncharacterized protein n=1 Tax=Chaetomium tenue TaxID=1854479 RepID=A0ACB7PMB2_9PEZI|nr:hypothetical protein F5144DRAFT_482178 [Chaetomium globosum]
MESVKASLNLLMTTTQFEAMVMGETRMHGGSEESNKELQKQIRRLRRVIKHHLNTVQDLRTQLNHIRHPERKALFDSLDHELMGEDALTELGWSIYERGTIPVSPKISPSSSVQNHPSQRLPSARRRLATTPHPVHSPRQAAPEPPDPPTSTSPVLSSDNIQEPPSLNHKTLRYEEKDVVAVTSGYVKNINGFFPWRQTTASVVESLDGNFISINKARELNLDIESPNLTANVMFDFGTGKLEKSFGKTTFKWRSRNYVDARYPPLIITCDVCENSRIGLVLGKTFLDVRGRFWP